MADQLDNNFKKRIKEVFDNYEDEHADAGWLLLREKFPEKQERRPVAWLWWSSVAALILFFLGMLLFKGTSLDLDKEKLAVNKLHPTHQLHPTNSIAKNIGKEEKSNITVNRNTDSSINHLSAQNIADNNSHLDGSYKNIVRKSNQKHAVSPMPNSVINNSQIQNIASNNSDKNTTRKSNQNEVKSLIANKQISNNNSSNQLIVENNITTQDKYITVTKANNTKMDSVVNHDLKLANSKTLAGINMKKQVEIANKNIFADNGMQQVNQVNEKPEDKYKTDKSIRFGIYAATYFNYAKGSSSQLNIGAGVTSDIKLTKNLNISTGLAIGQNSLNFETSTTQAAIGTQVNTTPVVAITAKILSPNQNLYSVTKPLLKNYNASMVGLDVPLNLKYAFNTNKSTYVSFGVNSGTFINETYTSTYNYVMPSITTISPTTDKSNHQSFSNFYFAKTLNFSFGTGYSLGSSRLIIEPFLKYPLEGIGAQQLKFGSGGINLKFNVQPKKK